MCLASCATELATNSDATSAMITASGAAPPAKDIPIGIEKAVAMAGAMKVIDWNRTPPKPTAPLRSPSVRVAGAAGPGPAGGGPLSIAIGKLLSVGSRASRSVCAPRARVERSAAKADLEVVLCRPYPFEVRLDPSASPVRKVKSSEHQDPVDQQATLERGPLAEYAR